MSQSQPETTDNEELLAELKRVGGDLAFRAQVRKYLKVIFALILFGMFVSGVVIYGFFRLRDVQHDVCIKSNEFRKAYVDQWTPIIADNPLPDPPSEDAPQEVKDAYERQKRSTERFIEGLATDFAPYDC